MAEMKKFEKITAPKLPKSEKRGFEIKLSVGMYLNPLNASKKSSENSVCICRLLQIFAYIIQQS